jgi:hypothetical protein
VALRNLTLLWMGPQNSPKRPAVLGPTANYSVTFGSHLEAFRPDKRFKRLLQNRLQTQALVKVCLSFSLPAHSQFEQAPHSPRISKARPENDCLIVIGQGLHQISHLFQEESSRWRDWRSV